MSNEDIGEPRVISVGHTNFVVAERIVALLGANSLPVKRMREKATIEGRLVDATAGRKMRSVIVMDSGHVVLSALATQTLQERVAGERPPGHAEWRDGEFVS